MGALEMDEKDVLRRSVNILAPLRAVVANISNLDELIVFDRFGRP